jgi:class 3 adenylate cyclase
MVVCSQCGVENPDGFRFCGGCGSQLAPALIGERRERRVVSVLFADLVGFTRRSERLDVEDVERFLAPYQALLGGCVDRTGGAVAKFTGDGVMAVFGGVLAHEDDAERAVRCGLMIRDGLAESESDAGDDRLRVRVGVTTGEALISLGASGSVDAVGDVVNTAARLESAAPVDGVLVDEWTFRATSRAIRYDDAAPVEAKGKSEAVAAWVAVEPRSIVPEQQRDQLPLVGRDTEASMLRDALDRSRREPSTQLASVIGEPGIGKTRLVEELFSYVGGLPDLITWRRGRSLSYGEGVAFWALGEMVKAQAGILESDSADVAEQKLSEAVAGVILDERDRDWVARQLRPLVGLDALTSGGEGSQVEAFAAWRRFVEAVAEDGPTVLMFEDIHWADDALLDFIELIANRAGAVPLLIVCTARPELLERRERWGGGMTNAQTISLTPLSDEDTARLVGGLLDQLLLPAEVQGTLLERAEGNPLYAQEYVRMLQDRELLVREAGGWTLAAEIIELPESLHGIIAARLDTLSAEEKVLIQDAAVVGKTAWVGAVCALTERSGWQAEELLHGLERKQLVQRVRRSSIQGETEFQFGHALTRDVAYSQIRRADRAQKHEAAAGWIEQLAGQREDKAELLADHYTQALALRQAMGEDTTPIIPKARPAFAEAAKQASAVNASFAAARHYHAAIELTAADDPERPALLLGEATARYDSQSVDAIFFGEVIAAQVADGAWEAAAGVEDMLGNWYGDHEGDGDSADAHHTKAAEYAARVPTSEVTCRIAAHRAFRLYLTGRPAEAAALVNELIPAADQPGLELGRARLLEVRSMARVDLGDTDGGVGDMQQAAEIFAAHAAPYTNIVYSNAAELARSLGDFPATDAALTAATEWATRYAKAFDLEYIACARADRLYHQADWTTALQLISQIRTTNQFSDANIRLTRGRITLARGDTETALDDAKAITGFATTSQNDELLFEGLALDTRVHVAQHHLEAARTACDQYLTNWHRRQGMLNRAITLCELAPTLAMATRHHDLRQAALLLPDACRWREALLLTADQEYAEAAEVYEQLGSQPLAADAHLLAARQASEQGRVAEAALRAQAVLAFAEQTGATLYGQQAAHFLEATA